MVKYELQIEATLDNLTDLVAHGEDFKWHLKFRCLNCHHQENNYVSQCQLMPLEDGNGEANLVGRCKSCSREYCVDVLSETLQKYTAEDSDTLKTIVVFDCWGTEPIVFRPQEGFRARGRETGTVFEDIPLDDSEWVGFDEVVPVEVGVYDFSYQFVPAL